MVGAVVAAAIVVIAAIVVPLTLEGGGGTTPTAHQAANLTTTVPVATSSALSTPSTAAPTTAAPTTTTAAPTTTTRPQISTAASTSPAINLAAPSGLGQTLASVWAHARPGGVSMSVDNVAGVMSGTAFYAEQPAITTYWAIARFVPSSQVQSAGGPLLAQFSETAMFVKVSGKQWAYLGEYTTSACGQAVPNPVLLSWGMC